tara:strand:- start:5742 stop:5924 length:183 start_codon:yes stop_codon:yes gene_type:complete
MKCHICNKHKIKIKDYRFIDSVGLQGGVLACKYCFSLNDVTIVEIIKNNLNPKTFYTKEK